MEFLMYWIRVGIGLAIASVSFVVAWILVLCFLAMLGLICKKVDKKEN